MSALPINGLELFIAFGGLVLTLVNLWLLFAVKSFKDDLITLRSADATLTEKVGAIQVMVAGQYVTRHEFQEALRAQTTTILTRMDEISKRYYNGVNGK